MSKKINNEIYFLFYAQDQLPIYDKDDLVDTFINNLRVKNEFKRYINDFLDNNTQYLNKFYIISNLKKFNNIYNNSKIQNNSKINFSYYIFYLINVYYNYNKYKILIELIKNELLKFNIKIDMIKDDSKFFNINLYKKKIEGKGDELFKKNVLDYWEIDKSKNNYFDNDIIKKIGYDLNDIKIFLKENKIKNNLFSRLNNVILNFIEIRTYYKFNSRLPDIDNRIIKNKLIFSFILKNKSNSIILPLATNKNFKKNKELIYKESYVDKIITQIKEKKFPSEINFSDIFNENEGINSFFNLNNNSLNNKKFKNELFNKNIQEDIKYILFEIIHYLREKTLQNYDSCLIYKKKTEIKTGYMSYLHISKPKIESEYLYLDSHIFNSEDFENSIPKSNILKNI